MRNIYWIISSLIVVGLSVSCRNEDLNPLVQWESGVHAYGVFEKDSSRAANKVNFPTSNTQASSKIDFKIRWVSLDQALTVNKIEVYLDFREKFLNADKNEVLVSHGTKLMQTIEPKGNRVWNNFIVTADQVYQAFKDAKYKYDGTNEVNVFANPLRIPTNRFLSDRKDPDTNIPENQKLPVGADSFVLTWRLYTTDGKVFKSWSTSVCTEITTAGQGNSNCQLTWTVK